MGSIDNKAFYKLSYGVFLLGTKSGEKKNACITNTLIQVTSNPMRVAFAVINNNYTCDLIKKSGVFAMSVLDESATFELIKHFGYQSGRDVDKLAAFDLPVDENGCPYLTWGACAVISGKVESSQDLGSHTLFVAEVTEARTVSDKDPMTYAYYQANVKPKNPAPAAEPKEKKIVAWKCKICGFVYEGSELPKDYVCPTCAHPAEDFEPVYAE